MLLVGKTTLVNEVLRPVSIEKGYFAYGKFDQLSQNIPYSPFVTAIESLIRQLMTESKEQLAIWKQKILRTLGKNGAIITDLIPELERIIGRQSPVEALQPKEAQNRFLMLFGSFIKIFANPEHPLVLFLDDLQWADSSSLRLISYLCRRTGLKGLIIVGAYRENEITAGHPLHVILEEIKKDGITVKEINLPPLNLAVTVEFIAGTLGCTEQKAEALAEILYRKTCGIPFFIGQLLKSIYKENIIEFDMNKGCWEWDAESIHRLQIHNDVIAFMLDKLQKFHEETRRVLKFASCIGNTFDLETLSEVMGKTNIETAALLMPAILEGLVLQVHRSETNNQLLYLNNTEDTYEFLHDMVRQTAYSMIPEEEKKYIHVKIGRSILKNTDKEQLDRKLLSVLDHINRGFDLINDPEEKLKFAEYNLMAGRKAKASAAYNLARDYFRAGTKFIGDMSWNSCRRLYYELYLERAQGEYLTGNSIEAEQLFNTIINNVETEIEKADVYFLKMNLYTGAGKLDEAVQIGINTLKDLGVKVPIRPGILNNARELLLYKWYMRNKNIRDLLELPEMRDKVQRKIAQLIIGLILATSISHPDLYSFLIIKLGNHTLKYGNMETSSIGYVGYGITEGSVLGNYSKGYEFGKVAIEHVEKFGRINSKCIVYFTMGALICHWTRHSKEGIQYLQKAARYAIEAGDVLTAGYSYSVILDNKFFMGTALEEILEDAKKYKDYSHIIRHENLAANAEVYGWTASILIYDRSSDSQSALSQGFDEARLVKSLKDDKTSLATYHSIKMQICYLLGNYDDALRAAEKVKSYKEAIMGFIISAEYIFYYTLTILAMYNKLAFKERKRFQKILNKNRRYMKKWSDSCPFNFKHKYMLVEAEVSRIFGRTDKAMELYDQAIKFAHENGYLQNEAIACELAARFYKDEGRNKVAKVYMNDAFRLYYQWGAKAKVQDLKSRYPELLDEVEIKEEKSKPDSEEILKSIILLSSITEGEAAISSEIYTIQNEIKSIAEQSEPHKLLTNIMEVILKITGADRGELIFEKDEELFVEVSKENKNSLLTIIKPVPVEKIVSLPKQVIRYVVRTHEPIIVNNCKQAGIFSRDPYIAESKGKSIVCIPLKLKGISVGVLYLENSFKEGAFTQKHIQLLEFLADQMIYVKALQDFLGRNNSGATDGVNLKPVDYLTERETEVLQLIAAGLSNKEIAENLNMTVNTVKTHIKSIYGKLQVNRRVQAVEKARELKIL